MIRLVDRLWRDSIDDEFDRLCPPLGERIIVCGSREFRDLAAVHRYVRDVVPAGATIITGGARGPDREAEIAARARGLKVEVFDPSWEMWGKAAGMIRNKAMLDAKPTKVVAFYDGSSRGTAMMIREARRRGIPVEVIEQRRSGALW